VGEMPVKYDKLFALLKNKGVTTYRIRKEKIISEGTLQNLREGKSVTVETISTLCALLDCQPGDLMEYIPDDK
jgi:putative transcriptional regulator